MRTGWSGGIVRQEYLGRVAEQALPVPVHELDGDVLQRDDEVESDAAILQAQEITKRDLVRGVGKPRNVDEFRVVVQVAIEADVEDSRQLALPDGGKLCVSPGRVEHEHLLVCVLGPREISPQQCQDVDGDRQQCSCE